jgi:hypothetical protein
MNSHNAFGKYLPTSFCLFFFICTLVVSLSFFSFLFRKSVNAEEEQDFFTPMYVYQRELERIQMQGNVREAEGS